MEAAVAAAAAGAPRPGAAKPTTSSIDVLLFFSASSSHSNSRSSSDAFGLLRGSLRSIAAIASLAAGETCRQAGPLNSGSSRTIDRKVARSVSPRNGGFFLFL